jgi:hypothetical protein
MSKTSFNDLAIVHRYMEEITTFIQSLVTQESRAVVLACGVMEDHKKANDRHPFASEADRRAWLFHQARTVAINHLKWEEREKTKDKAIVAAIRDSA